MKYLCFLFLGVLIACHDPVPESYGIVNADLNGGLSALTYSGGDNNSTKSYESFDADLEEELPIIAQKVATTVPGEDQKIIKRAGLRFETQDLDGTHKNILSLTKALDGFISSDNAGKNYTEHFRNITIRIPSENFQAFIDDVSKGVGYFDRKDISRKDVSEEFVDLNARLKAKRELEKRYLELLKQARNVEEMLDIERELSKIREEIEAKEGRLNYLKDKVSMSTISLQFYKYTNETRVTVSYGQKMKNALSGGWDGISVFFIGLLSLWPLFLILIILILWLRRWMKRRKKRKTKKTD
jgi:hypothetical protein